MTLRNNWKFQYSVQSIYNAWVGVLSDMATGDILDLDQDDWLYFFSTR